MPLNRRPRQNALPALAPWSSGRHTVQQQQCQRRADARNTVRPGIALFVIVIFPDLPDWNGIAPHHALNHRRPFVVAGLGLPRKLADGRFKRAAFATARRRKARS